MSVTIPSIEETFIPMLGRMRVVDKRDEPGRGPRGFVVMLRPLGVPDTEEFEVELASFQYRPHAQGMAAIPEMVDALIKSGLAVKAFMARDVGRAHPTEADIAAEAIFQTIVKAETYEY